MRTGHLTLGRIFPALWEHGWKAHIWCRKASTTTCPGPIARDVQVKTTVEKWGRTWRGRNIRSSAREKRFRHKREEIESPRIRNSEWKEKSVPMTGDRRSWTVLDKEIPPKSQNDLLWTWFNACIMSLFGFPKLRDNLVHGAEGPSLQLFLIVAGGQWLGRETEAGL